MNQRTRRRLQFLGIAGLICFVGLFLVYGSWDRREMLRVTLLWGRLAPIPASARHLTITKEGSMFTRAFRASFSAPVSDIEQWLGESPGTREAAPERHSPTTRRFLIKPGGGAQWAEVTVDDTLGEVRIYVYWS
jgi:hypothetical protein